MSATMRRAMVEAAKRRLSDLSREIGEADRARQQGLTAQERADRERGSCSPLGGQATPAPKEPPKAQPKGPKKFVW